jgi:hypothetical protein
MSYCLDEALFFEERFESSLEYDLVLQSEPVVEDVVVRMPFAPIILHARPSRWSFRPWTHPPARAPPELRL